MTGSFGLWRPAIRRTRAEWPVSLAAFLLLLCGTTLLASTTLYSDTVTQGGVRRAILDAPPASRVVLVGATIDPATVSDTDRAAREAVAGVLGPAVGPIARVDRVVTSEPGRSDDDGVRERVAVASYEGIADHATVVEGRWPAAGATPVEAALPSAAAERLGLAVGEVLTLNPLDDRAGPLQLRIVGRWQADSRDDAYWVGDPLELGGILITATERTTGPLVVDASDLAGLAGARAYVQWRAVPDPGGFPVSDLAGAGRSIAALGPILGAALPDGPELTVRSDLPDLLESVERSVLVSRSGMLLLTIQFAVLAGYAVLLVAGMLADRRRIEVALLQARGAGTGHLARIAVLEGLVLAVPAAILAPPLAWVVVSLMGAIGPLADVAVIESVTVGPDVIVVSVLAAAGYLVALVLPAVSAGQSVAGVRAATGRQVGRTLPQRVGIDIGLVLLAAIAIWQLRLYGAPLTEDARGALGIDPLLVLAPAIGLLAGAVMSTRLIPRLGEIGERLTGRRPTLVGPLSARQIARRPLRYTRVALLLMLATALGIFAAAQSATWTRSQVDQAAYQTAADARFVRQDYDRTPPWLVGDAIRAIDGVTVAMPVTRQVLDVGRAVRDAELLALDPAIATSLVPPPPASDPGTPELLARLATARPELALIPIEGRPTAIALELSAALGRPDDPEADTSELGSWPGLDAIAVLIDGDGRTQRIALDRGTLGGDSQRLTGSLREDLDGQDVAITTPIALLAVELRLTAPPFEYVAGSIGFDGVAVTHDGVSWSELPFDPTADGWSWTWSAFDAQDVPYRPLDAAPRRMFIGTKFTPVPGVSSGEGRVTVRIRATPGREAVVPAIAGTSFLAASGAEVGDRLAATTLGQVVTLEIVGSVETFPPLEPDEPWVIVDDPTFQRWRFEDLAAVAPPDEWWLGVEPGQGPTVAAALEASSIGSATIVERTTRTQALASDPVSLGVLGALAIGALAALAFAALGMVVNGSVSTGERRGEFALLGALGLTPGGLSRWLAIESVFLLATGLLAGSALGLLLAWLILPVAILTPAGDTPVPAPEVVVPAEVVVPLVLMAVVVLVVTLALSLRQLPGVRVSGILRGWEG